MREERGQVSGDVVVYEPYTLWGSVGGNVTVIRDGKLYVRGMICGNLIVERGGRVHIFGNVAGNLELQRHTKVIVSGRIGGDAINRGGRLYIEKMAVIEGKVKTRAGETKIQTSFAPEAEETEEERRKRWRDDGEDHRQRLQR